MGKQRIQRDLSRDPLVASKLDTQEASDNVSNRPKQPMRRIQKQKQPLRAVVNVGDTGLGEGGDLDRNIPLEALSKLAEIRAGKQSGGEQFANMLGQVVVGEIIGGTIEAAGYMADMGVVSQILKGDEREWGNFLTDAGQGLREWGQENMAIYQEKPGEFNMADSGWWFGNGVSIASSLSMLLPSMGAVKALGFAGKAMSKGMRMIHKSADIASQMGKKSKWMTQGVSQAVMSRQAENMMEAHGTFKESYDKYLNEGMGEKEARALASEAAAINYKAGWAMLLQDIPQYLLIGKIFNPMSGKVETALSKLGKTGAKPGFVKKALKNTAAFSSEGFEEGYQFMAAEEGKFYADNKAGLVDDQHFLSRMGDYVKDGEFWTSVVFGAIGGGVFQQVGPQAQKLFKSKETKENERNYLKNREKLIKQRGMEMAAKHMMVAQADQTGDLSQMREARMAVNISNTAEALSMNSYESHIENLNSLKNITEEEIEKYAKEGVEINKDMLNELIPKMVQESQDMRDDFYKLANKTESGIAASVALNNHYIKQFKKKSAENKSYVSKATEFQGASVEGKNIAKTELDIQALELANEYLNNEFVDAKTEKDKAKFKKQIDANAKEIKKKSKDLEKQKTSIKGVERTPEEKKIDKTLRSELDSDPTILDKAAGIILLDSRVDQYRDENAYKLSDEYKKKFKKEQALRELESIENLDDAKRELKKLEDPNGSPEAKANDPIVAKKREALKKRIAQLEAEKKKEKEKEDQENIIKDNEAKKDLEKDKFIPKVEKDPATVDNAEDPNSDFEDNPTDNLLDSQNKALDKQVAAGKSIRVMDTKPAATDEFIEYMNNGKSKVGDTVEYQLAPFDEESRRLVKLFEEFRDGDQSDGELLRYFHMHLPLKAMYKNNPKITSGIHAAIPSNEAFMQDFMKQEFPERVDIITELLNNNKPLTTVHYQYGGKLQNDKLDKGEDSEFQGEYARNNPLDLLQMKGKTVKDMEVFISDEDGQLLNADTRNSDVTMGMRMTTKEVGKDGLKKPYAGGVFLKVKKTNGDNFPLKLDLARITGTEAETIADLMLDVRIHNKFNLGTPMSVLKEEHPEMVSAWKEKHPAEMNFIGPEGTPAEFMNLFVYSSDKTQKYRPTRLFMSGKRINAGISEITEKNHVEGRDKLINFLQTKKKRQFDRKLWSNKNPKSAQYRRYMLESGTLYTEGVVSEPLFSTKNDGNTSIYNKPVTAEVPSIEPTTPGEDLMISDAQLTGLEPVGTLDRTGGLSTTGKGKVLDVKSKLEEVKKNSEFIKLAEDGTHYVNTLTGKKLTRVTDFISEKKVEKTPLINSSTAIGNKLDELTRDFFDGKVIDPKDYDVSTEANIKSYIKALEKVKAAMDKRGEVVLANDIILFNDELGIAGTVDLLTYDKDNNVRIYDMKTMRGNQFEDSYSQDQGTSKYESTLYNKISNREKHRMQLSMYRILLNNTHGIKAKTTGIIPIEVMYQAGEATTSKINLLPGVQLKPLDEVGTAKIGVPTTQPQAFDEDGMPNMDLIEKSFGSMPTEMGYREISKEEWDNFVDNNIVTDARLDTIGETIAVGDPLNPQEQAIRAAFPEKIEIKLKEWVNKLEGTTPIVPAVESVELNYTPKGASKKKVFVTKVNGRYVIKNEKGTEIYAKDSVDRNKVLAKYGIAKQGARIVMSNDKPWVVWPNGKILSGISNKFMKWGPEHGQFKKFMAEAKFPPVPSPISDKNVVDLEKDLADKVVSSNDLMISDQLIGELMSKKEKNTTKKQEKEDQGLMSDKLLEDIPVDTTNGDLFDEFC